MRTRCWVSGFALLAALAGCSSDGTVAFEGRFAGSAPPPEEVRVMLDPHGPGEEARADERAAEGSYVSLYPDEDGVVRTEPFDVAERRWRSIAPIFFMSFANEKDVIYAIGKQQGVVQYRAFDAESRAPTDRSQTCWRLMHGRYERASQRSVILKVAIAPNFDSEKPCLPPGTFTPESVAMPAESDD